MTQQGNIAEVCQALIEAALPHVVAALERQPELVARVVALFGAQGHLAVLGASPPFMSIAKYAAHRCLSERSIRYAVEEMTEGKQYYRSGRKGGRVVINVTAADAWYAERSRSVAATSTIEQLAVDEVTRRRARVALNKRKEK